MHVCAFLTLLLWSKKEYGLLKSNLWRLGLRGFSNNGLNFSFNCFSSHLIYYELIKVDFMLRVCRVLLAKRRVSQYSRIRNLRRCPDHKEEL